MKSPGGADGGVLRGGQVVQVLTDQLTVVGWLV